LIENVDYFVRLINFPKGVNRIGFVLLNEDGTYSVYINARASEAQKRKAMRHEYAHMANDDLYGDKDIRTIENI
jgi:Zn-dependent peptidase ImmA (M78 family)